MGAWGLLGVSMALPSGVTSFHWDWAYVWKALPSLLKMIPVTLEPVSYTHLTLPTIA